MESGYDHPLHRDPYITNDVKCAACRVDPYNEKFLSDHTCSKYSRSSEDRASAYTFDNYQDDAGTTAIYPDSDSGSPAAIAYVILGLVGESGEIANKYKKVIRDNDGIVNLNQLTAIADEIGDVLWYCARLASELGVQLSTIADKNYHKLNSRKHRDVLDGSGDDR